MKDVVTRVVDKRLKIKPVEDKFAIVSDIQAKDHYSVGTHRDKDKLAKRSKRYMVYFVDPPQGVADNEKKERF